jgi:UrcA family protein
MLKLIAPLALAALLAAPSATAASRGQEVHEPVAYGDLALDRPAGVTQLNRRVTAALTRVCGDPLPRALFEKMQHRSCMADGRRRVTPKLLRIIQAAQGTSLESLAHASPSPFAEQ